MEALVESVLKYSDAKEATLKPTEVNKPIDIAVDEGNLLSVDSNPLDGPNLRSSQEEYLGSLARDNVQVLFNKIWELKTEAVEDAVVCELPEPKTLLPREKPIPKPKPATKWEEYAKLKGIQKTKKSRMIWDDEAKEWRPRWGYKRANDETKQWAIEVPQNADPFEDQFEKLKNAKKERVAKNELARLRNISRNMKGRMPGIGLPSGVTGNDKDHYHEQLAAARTADASKGKFTRDLKKEQPLKNTGKRRKFDSNTNSIKTEKERAMSIVKSINGKRDILNVDRTTNIEKNEGGKRAAKRAKGDSKKKAGAAPKGRRSKAGGKNRKK